MLFNFILGIFYIAIRISSCPNFLLFIHFLWTQSKEKPLVFIFKVYDKNQIKNCRHGFDIRPSYRHSLKILFIQIKTTLKLWERSLFTFALLHDIFVNVRVTIANIPAKHCSILLKTLYTPTPYNLFSWRNHPSKSSGGGYPYIAITSSVPAFGTNRGAKLRFYCIHNCTTFSQSSWEDVCQIWSICEWKYGGSKEMLKMSLRGNIW